MDLSQIILIIGAIAGLLSALFVGFKGLRESKTGATTSKAAIDARIDARIERELSRLEADIAVLQKDLKTANDKIECLEKTESATRVENTAIKQAVKKWFHALRVWDRQGRPGQIPLPDEGDLARLELNINTGEIPITTRR